MLSTAGDAATPNPLPKILKPVLATPGLFLLNCLSALDLLALIVDGAASAADPARATPSAGN